MADQGQPPLSELPPRSQVVPHGFTSMSFKSESRPTWAWRPSRQGFWEISGGNFAGISMKFDECFFLILLDCFLVIFEMNFGWFNDDLWWFISSHKIAICDFGDDFWDDFSLQKMFGISLTMCWNHRHPRFWGFCYGLYQVYLAEMWSCPYGWLEGNWEAPTSISKPRLKPPGRPATTWNCTEPPRRWRVMRWPSVRIHEKQVKNQNKFAVVHVIWRVWSITKKMHGISWHLLLILDFSSDTTNLDYQPKSHVI